MSSQVSETGVALKSLSRTVAKVRLDAKCMGHESEVREVEEAITEIKELLNEKDMTRATQTLKGRNCIRSLNEVICEVDDMFDQLIALQHQGPVKLSETIKNFMTSSSSSSLLSKEFNRVRNKWKNVSESLKKFDAAGDSVTDSLNTEETFSQLYEPAVIGRDGDVECVLDLILPSVVGETSSVCIVGIGGLGKTTLAQLVFNDAKVAAAFPLRIWVFVGRRFNFHDIHAKIARSVKGRPPKTKYLFVLDDLWCDEKELIILKEMVTGWKNGSCILSTTRSRKTADLMANTGHVYELKGLSDDDSWGLLQTTAFDRGEEPDSQLVEIGRKICAKCCNVPLALKVIGSLLYYQDLRKWLALSTTFDNTIYGSGNLLSSVKLSYDILESPLKWCFTLCALFPKDYIIRKELLISLWIAHGYVEPSSITGESTEKIAERYFNTLLENSFFQEIRRDDYGDVVSCSIHGLMHELAQQLVGEETGVVQSLASVTAKSRHVYHDGKEDDHATFGKMSIRTYLQSDFGGKKFPVSTLLENCRSLRALSLHNLDDPSLPETIGKLVHLRYLDLSRNKKLQTLPKSLTKLCNLETLDLRDCSSLTTLPSDLSSLMLRRLDISGCTSLTCMPRDLKKFTCLRTLTLFVMDERDLSHKLEDLETFLNLKGSIEILLPADYTVYGNERRGLMGKTDLKAVCIHFRESDRDVEKQIAVLDKLQPHENLQGLTLKGYLGHEFHLTNHLVKLVKLELRSCKGLINLPFIDRLIFLKSLVLDNLENLEYVQKASTIVSSQSDDNKIFPSLEYLEISELPKFENWWGRSGSHNNDLVSSQFPHVYHLVIESCPVLASFPLFPAVKKLHLMKLNRNFSIHALNPGGELNLNELKTDNINYLRIKPGIQCIIKSKFLKITDSAYGQSDDDKPWKLVKDGLRNLELESMESMERLPIGMKLLKDLQHLTISRCKNLMEIPEWISGWEYLETLCIRHCTGINKFPESMRKLIYLRRLHIEGHPHLQKRCEAIHGDDWPKLLHIQSITCPKVLPLSP